jgi:hypothetical protein
MFKLKRYQDYFDLVELLKLIFYVELSMEMEGINFSLRVMKVV